MAVRTPPADTDRFRYNLKEIRLGGTEITLWDILRTAVAHGSDQGVHLDDERAEVYADVCQEYNHDAALPDELTLTVSEALLLHEAVMSAHEYALANNYDDDGEPNEDDRNFGKYGKLMLGILTIPWEDLHDPADGTHGVTYIG
jgi:hypothetical protein